MGPLDLHGFTLIPSSISDDIYYKMWAAITYPLRWRHNDHAGVSNHQPHGCLLNRLFRRKSKKTSKLRVTGLCVGNSPGTGEFPAQMASYAENVSIWWRHHEFPNFNGVTVEVWEWMNNLSYILLCTWLFVHGGIKGNRPTMRRSYQNFETLTIKRLKL